MGIATSPTKMVHNKNKWIQNSGLIANDREIILNNQDLCNSIITVSPSLYFAHSLEHCPCETIQIIHNVHHWILLASLNRKVNIFNSLNTHPTIEALQQNNSFFLPTTHFDSASYHHVTNKLKPQIAVFLQLHIQLTFFVETVHAKSYMTN